MQHSMDAVSHNWPASWPSDVPCANISYSGPDRTYNHVVSLFTGSHTLHTGIQMETAMPCQGWEQAWIEIVDTIGPLFPGVEEVRDQQFC